MTQISGQIFQMTNGKTGAALENRFPRTVMEAVLGLNTYLQNQFGALADIYMPIEGITESKPLQEFVYRACPSTIKAKSLSLDRIYGKTLAWNNIVINGDFSNGTTDWVASSGTISASNNILTWSNSSGAFYQPRTFIVGHLYYICAGVKCDSTFEFGASNVAKSFSGSSSSFSTVSNIIQAQIANNTVYFYPYSNTSMQFKQISCVDLTLMFGAGNEPSTVAEFESMFPGYHDYEPGKLISNDAESIETVGFNQWDEEYVFTGIKTADGTPDGWNDRICSKNFIPAFPNTSYYFKMPMTSYICCYDKDKIFLGQILFNGASYLPAPGAIGTTLPNTAFIKFSAAGNNYGTTYSHDICINLSDPAKNGTYEPYRKSTMQLNLGSFQVRDSQGNVTTIEGGLKSDGSGKYDEIVGNKFIQRASRRAYQSGDENDQTVVTDGTHTDYGLATPIEYTLVSPLVPTVKAGTTEARISPNSDGLSAPMVADMTYDAQANNDSASAQYALAAGRLLNSHKLWGQDFDGTQDVTGALTEVTNLNGLLYLGSSNVGIGQSSPAYKLDVNGTFRATGAATFGSTISASGNISTTGQLISTKATGTAPLSVASTTRVANLNADLLDGYEAIDFIATLQSLWSQIDSVATRTDFDLLNVTQLLTDTVSASTAYLEKITVTSTASISGATTLGSTLSVAGLATLVSGAKLTTTKKIWFGDTYYIELDSNNRLHTNAPIVSDSFITAGAAAS